MLLCANLAFADDAPRVWVGAGLSGAVGVEAAPDGGGGVGIEAGVRLGAPRRSVALVARLRESVLTGPLRTVGNVEAQIQWPAGTGAFGFAGFSHNHEASAADWLAEPLAVTLGTAAGITHRSGVEVGVGWTMPPPYRETPLLARVRPTCLLTVHVFPDAGGPFVYGVAEVGLRVGVDPR